MGPRIHKRTACRLCAGQRLQRFLHLPDMPLTDELVRLERCGQEVRADIDVYFCETCKGVQTLHDIELAEYYRDYRYTVSGSAAAKRFMSRLAEETFRRFGFGPGDHVIEVGSGDGFQLSCFQKLGARVLGIEPAAHLAAIARASGVEVLQCLCNAETVERISAEMRPAQVVLLTYTFDHLPDPRGFLQAVAAVLDPQRGVLVVEVHDLEKIVQRAEACLFEHEHTIYLHRWSIKRLLETAGFGLLTTELLPETQRRGNSLLVAAALREAEHEPDSSAMDLGASPMDAWGLYADFAGELERRHARMRQYVRSATTGERRIAGYGAGGRGVMTLAMAGLTDRDIVFLCDCNTCFHGLYTPATHIPVVPPERLLEDPVDEVIVFSYGYLAEIREQLHLYAQRGGRFVSMLDLLK